MKYFRWRISKESPKGRKKVFSGLVRDSFASKITRVQFHKVPLTTHRISPRLEILYSLVFSSCYFCNHFFCSPVCHLLFCELHQLLENFSAAVIYQNTLYGTFVSFLCSDLIFARISNRYFN